MATDETKLTNTLKDIANIKKSDTEYLIQYSTGEKARLYILNHHVFRLYMSPTGEFLDYPKPLEPNHKAKITKKQMNDYDMQPFRQSQLVNAEAQWRVITDKIEILFDKTLATLSVIDKRNNKKVLRETSALTYSDADTTQLLQQHHDEFFFGGGMQNGRFTHKGRAIDIVNTNNWIDGGVTSPCPFYWSTYGYGILRNTWQRGRYDFTESVATKHTEDHYDAFFFINPQPGDILMDYYELCGAPILMPEYAFYEAHLNTFNRDYWVKVDKDTPRAILFEDGEYYKSYQPSEIGDKVGILTSLNGEKNNYQFSARAMIDRYKKWDMPIGWFVPNDGYGSGYGQTDSLDGDIDNLKQFADYARSNGIEVGLWTESNLFPADPKNPKKGERDLSKEVDVAGVVALKADVAWIGDGYSFGLDAIEYVAKTFVEVSKDTLRPMAIMVDGWAGTQRCAGIWSGDQMGGQWEYIRFHIPTYIGSGLSGQPNIGSDMDGIYGGKDRYVNIRDYQWKAFTPMQLNMDGWGWIPKTPFTFDHEAIKINRAYLKLKAMLMPYNYTIAHESTQGLPMIRAMFLEFPNEVPAYTTDSQYQYMWGPSMLIAPIYEASKHDDNSDRNFIYLPDRNQVWIDFYSGMKYQGGRIMMDMKTPLWKLPVFIRDGAIIPMTNPNNNPSEIKRDHRIFYIYPSGKSEFELYEDDGTSTDYINDNYAKTKIYVHAFERDSIGTVLINIENTIGHHKLLDDYKTTELRIMASEDVKSIKAAINDNNIQLKRAETKALFDSIEDVYYYDDNFTINPYLTDLMDEEERYQKFLLIKIHDLHVKHSTITIKLTSHSNKSPIFASNDSVSDSIDVPDLKFVDEDITPTSITVTIHQLPGVDYYDIERDEVLFSHIRGPKVTFDYFEYDSTHNFRIRSLTSQGLSKWSPIYAAKTKEDPYKNAVKHVKVSCNFPSQPNEEVEKLTDGNFYTMWHTKWGNDGIYKSDEGQSLKLTFDLGDVFNIAKVEYHPRSDGGNGNFLKIAYKTSVDGTVWTDVIDVVWTLDAEVKSIDLGECIRYMEIEVHDSVRHYGSGRQIVFLKVEEAEA